LCTNSDLYSAPYFHVAFYPYPSANDYSHSLSHYTNVQTANISAGFRSWRPYRDVVVESAGVGSHWSRAVLWLPGQGEGFECFFQRVICFLPWGLGFCELVGEKSVRVDGYHWSFHIPRHSTILSTFPSLHFPFQASTNYRHTVWLYLQFRVLRLCWDWSAIVTDAIQTVSAIRTVVRDEWVGLYALFGEVIRLVFPIGRIWKFACLYYDDDRYPNFTFENL
jgi:hypothetical protein